MIIMMSCMPPPVNSEHNDTVLDQEKDSGKGDPAGEDNLMFEDAHNKLDLPHCNKALRRKRIRRLVVE